MKTALKPLIVAALMAAALPAWAGNAEVSYAKPDDFRDAGRDSIARQRTMDALTHHLVMLARRLPASQSLKVEFTDIDLAGALYPDAQLHDDRRVLRGGADWPRLWLRYSLQDGSRTVSSGEARLADLGYATATLGGLQNAELAHEKRLLKQWFDNTFAAAMPR